MISRGSPTREVPTYTWPYPKTGCVGHRPRRLRVAPWARLIVLIWYTCRGLDVSIRGSQGYGRKGSTIVSINSIIRTIAKNRQFSPILFPGQNALPMVWTIQLDEKTRVRYNFYWVLVCGRCRSFSSACLNCTAHEAGQACPTARTRSKSIQTGRCSSICVHS